MQPRYGLPNIHHRHQQQQDLMEVAGCCSEPVLPISNLQTLNHPYQSQQQPKNPHHVFLQQQHQLFSPFQQQQEERLYRQIQQQQHRQQLSPQNPSFFNVNFKLGPNGSNGNKKVAALKIQQEEAAAVAAATSTAFLDGDCRHSDNPLPHGFLMSHSWHSQEDSTAIKEPFWKPLNKQHSENEDQEINGNKTNNKFYKPSHIADGSSERCRSLENKSPLFNELEAIYNLAKIADANQTGSGSVLTDEYSPTNAGLSMPFSATNGQNVGAICGVNTTIGVDHGSENSIGEEALVRKSQKRKRKTKLKQKLSDMAVFFENMVKQVIDHQEILHRKFLAVIERMDKERTEREETWRRQEAAKNNREALARAHEQALASSREAQIVSYIEKITGQTINLPTSTAPPLLQPEISIEPVNVSTPMKPDSHNRWPKDEVEALIQVRSRIETKFLEPGLKGPLWEEVSSLMCSMGYQRSAKRCKEKWENINKYFRKAKEGSKKRSQQSKTCSYFNQLDRLYSGSLVNDPLNTTFMPSSNCNFMVNEQCYPEHPEAFSVARDLPTITNPSKEAMKCAEINSLGFEFDGIADGKVELEEGSNEKDKENHEDDQLTDVEQQKDHDGGGSDGDQEIGN